MSDILKQIQALQEQFSNLFEVEGLGNPAVDVPPSQNKIKKDVKTKDGKAELVSVEDELFPYDGNKREQYRQKILDTINGMIQGTSTLEDLLQIVRQKKAPLKEAMELMEDIRSAIEKKHGKPEYYSGRSPWQVGREPANKSAELTQKANEIKEKEALQAAERELYKDRPDLKDAHPAKKNYKVADYYGQIMARRNGKAPLKEAMELMEDLFSTILKQPDEKQGALVYKYHQAKNKENAGKDTYTQAKEEEKRKSKEEKGQEKTEQRKKYRGKSTEDWKLGRLMDQIARNAKNLGKVEDSATAKAVRRNAQKADLKEALEIMEDLWSKIQEQPSDKKKELTRMYHKMKQKEGKTTSDIINDRKKHMTKQEKGQEKTEERNQEAWKRYLDAVRDYTENTPSMYQFEALEEALSLMEAIINEFNDDVKVKVGKIRADKALDSMKQLRNNSIALRKAQNNEEREKIANEMSKNSDELDVNYKKAKKFTNLFNRNVKDNNKKQELKNYITTRGAADDKEYREKVSEALEEALEIMEAIINEVSDKTANSFLEKRVINALNAWYNDDKLNKKEDDAVKALIKRKARQGKELSDDEKKRIGEA